MTLRVSMKEHEHLLEFQGEAVELTEEGERMVEIYCCIDCGALFDGHMEPLMDAAEVFGLK